MIDENIVWFIAIPDTQITVVLDVVGCRNQGTIFAAVVTAFSFLGNDKKVEILIGSLHRVMSKED